MATRWFFAASALALAASTGCSLMHGSETKSDTASAQSAASGQFQRAADAQKVAAEEQVKAEQADKVVADAQKALAEAETKATGQHQRAAHAQDTARRLGQEASQQGMSEQKQATSSMQREGAATGEKAQQRETWRDQQNVSGRVVESSGSNLRVRSAGQSDLNVKLDDSSAVRLNGREAKTDQIQPGDEVRVSYQLVDGKATAVRVDVRRRAAGASGSPATTGSTEKSSSSPDQSGSTNPK
ncbi:MAG TPA: hypothetical protein VN883_14575 [Myxococcales bacterium]|jgi:hypothetical protein|nr:hypothetical protein [Myxococcales bacterium]